MAAAIDGGEDYFCIDSKPIEICRPACAKRCSMGKNEIEKAPSFGYCASQGVYYYGSLVSTKKSKEFFEIIEIQIVIADFEAQRFEITFAV